MKQKNRNRFGHYLVTLGLAVFLAGKLSNGKLNFYINERFFPLTIFAIITLWCMATFNLLSAIQPEKKAQTENKLDPRFVLAGLTSSLPILCSLVKLPNPVIYIVFIFCSIGSYIMVLRYVEQSQFTAKHIPPYALILLALPVLIGLSTPEQPLSSESLDTRGVSLTATFSSAQESNLAFDIIEDDRTILDWIKLSSDSSTYIGQQANVVGFVYHDARLDNGQFMLSRFVITCCVADALAVGLPVNGMDRMDLPDNTWVHVKGTLDKTSIDGDTVPLIQATSIEIIEAPEQPYLYP